MAVHEPRALDTFALDTLDALPLLVAVVNPRGVIVAVNRAWSARAREAGGTPGAAVDGQNLFDVCAAATTGSDGGQAARVAAALREILAGDRDEFDEQQCCHVNASPCWFRTRIRPFVRGGERWAVVSYDDLSPQESLELTRTQRALQQAEQVGRAGTWTADLVRNVFYSPGENALLLGWEPGVHTPEELRALIHPDDRALQEAAWAEAMTTGRFEVEHRAIVRGEIRWFHVQAEIRHDADGRPVEAIGVAQDITEERQVRQALQESRAEYAELAEASPDAILVNRDDHVAFVNRACVELLCASSADELIGRPVLELFHPDTRRTMLDRLAVLRQEHPVPRVETLLQTLDGRTVPVEVVAAPFASAGAPSFPLVLRDISERIELQRALSNERAGLRTLLDTIPDFVWVKDIHGRFLLGNPAFEHLTGLSETALVGRTDDDFFPREVAEVYRAEDAAAIRQGGPIYIAAQQVKPASTGAETWLETVKTPLFSDGHLVGVLGVARDITEKRRVQAALERSEQQRQFALDAAQLGTWYHVDGTRQIFIDARSRSLLDVDTPADLVDVATVTERFHPDDRARASAIRHVESARPQAFELRIIRRDGAVRWVLVHVHVGRLPGTDGQTEVVRSGTLQDITERKEHEAMAGRFVSASPVVIYALQIQGDHLQLRWVSDNIEAFSGWPVEDTFEPDWWRRNIHPEDRDRVIAAQTLSALGEHHRQEFRFRRADAAYMWVADERRLVRDALGQPAEVVGSWTDITDRVRLEEQLRQSQKIEALGLLAGGIAHDFNNMLTVVAGNVDLLSPMLPAAGSERHLLDEIRDAGERAAALTRQLLAFSRSQVLAPREVRLNRVVDRTRSMLRRLIGEDVRFECRLAPDSGWVLVDPGQLEQVIVNLAVNARDAMPEGGELVIETDAVELDADYARLHPGVQPGPYARLVVADTGHGMSSEVMARIWEPFFTSKPPGQGTGLGLSTVFGIVKQSGGQIDVESAVGQGTRFVIHLPRVLPADELPVQGFDAVAGKTGRPRHETILLVEDEEAVRKLAKIALERSGYAVLVAANGRAAMDVAGRHAGGIDLLVTDVVMPEMRGPQLAAVLRERRPALKVLFMSGYIQDAAERTDLAEQRFLHKPFSLRQLTDTVRDLLDYGL